MKKWETISRAPTRRKPYRDEAQRRRERRLKKARDVRSHRMPRLPFSDIRSLPSAGRLTAMEMLRMDKAHEDISHVDAMLGLASVREHVSNREFFRTIAGRRA